jgi:hypothetical protein
MKPVKYVVVLICFHIPNVYKLQGKVLRLIFIIRLYRIVIYELDGNKP